VVVVVVGLVEVEVEVEEVSMASSSSESKDGLTNLLELSSSEEEASSSSLPNPPLALRRDFEGRALAEEDDEEDEVVVAVGFPFILVERENAFRLLFNPPIDNEIGFETEGGGGIVVDEEDVGRDTGAEPPACLVLHA
jgi:hypothetical protein